MIMAYRYENEADLREQIMDDFKDEIKSKNSSELKKELEKLNRRPGILSWFRDRVNSILNLMKIAVLSVAIGRVETAKRMDAGTRQKKKEDYEKKIINSVKKEMIQNELKSRENDMNRQAEKSVHDEKTDEKQKDGAEEKTNENEQDINKDSEIDKQEIENNDIHKAEAENEKITDEEMDRINKTLEELNNTPLPQNYDEMTPEEIAEQEAAYAAYLEENKDKDSAELERELFGKEFEDTRPIPTSEEKDIPAENQQSSTILEAQCHDMSKRYEKGLTAFLEDTTGIAAASNGLPGFILSNEEGKIKIDFSELGENNPYGDHITIDSLGRVEGTSIYSKDIGLTVLYYTSEVYRDSKNQTRFPGTVPSENNIKKAISDLIPQIDNKTHMAKTNLFLHDLTVIKTGNGKYMYQIDNGKRFEIKTEKDKDGILSVSSESAKKIVQDYKSEILGKREYDADRKPVNIEINRPLSDQYGNVTTYKEVVSRRGGDYSRIHETAERLHDIRNINKDCLKEYDVSEIKEHIESKLERFLSDNGRDTRDFYIGPNRIHIELSQDNGEKEVSAACVNDKIIYGDINNCRADNGYNCDIDYISEKLADHLSELEPEKIIDYEELLDDENLSGVTPLDENGKPVSYMEQATESYDDVNITQEYNELNDVDLDPEM